MEAAANYLVEFAGGILWWQGAATLAAVGLGYVTTSKLRAHSKHKAHNRLVDAHRAAQTQAIEAFLEKYPSQADKTTEQKILSASVAQLRNGMVDGKWQVEQVILIYCHAAARAHKETNCLTEIMFVEALKRAKELDRLPKKERIGVLFGVPVSLKDSLRVEGQASSIGVVAWKDNLAVEDAVIVDALVEAGAIPFCKTNVPQTMMSFECRNPLWGSTENPRKKGFSPGGSSGGEAALIGMGGSPLGVGSDIGGSIRIPAHFSGICGLKPSNHRLPFTGNQGFHPASQIIHPVAGPMARTVEDLVPMMEACMGWPDRDVVPTPFESIDWSSKKLRIGVMRHNGFCEALAPCIRAVNEAAVALEKAGHELVPFKLPFAMTDAASLMYGLISGDAAHFYRKGLGTDPVDESLQPFFFLICLPRWILRLFAKVTSTLYEDPRPSRFLSAMGRKDVVDFLELAGKRNQLLLQLNAAWKAAGIDVLLAPGFGTPALPHGSFPFSSFAASYTFLWNLVDYVAGALPVTTVQEQDVLVTKEDVNISTMNSTRLLERELEALYDLKEMKGLPIGVQLITPQFQEAECLAAMQILQDALKL